MQALYVALGVLCLISAYGVMAQDNDIDVVLKLLSDLSDNAKQELDLLDQDWQKSKTSKEAIINSLSTSVQQQRGECNNRDQDVSNKERDISITLNFIKWLEKRIVENNKRLDLLDQLRCRSNSNFIGDAKNNRRTQQLITFLKRAIENGSESNLPALLQTKEFTQHLQTFFKAQENVAVLLQIKQVDASEYDYVYDYEYDYDYESDSESNVDAANNQNDGEGQNDADNFDGDSDSQGDLAVDQGEPEDQGNAADQGDDSAYDQEDARDADDQDADAQDGNEQFDGDSSDSDPEYQVGQGSEDGEGSGQSPDEQFEAGNAPDVALEGTDESELEQEAEALATAVAGEDSPQSSENRRYTEAQQQLLDTLDGIDQEIKSMFTQFQNNQVISAMGQGDFQNVIRRENEAFDDHLTQENENLTRLSNQLITVLQACAQCKARLQQLNQALTFANEDLSAAEENYKAVRERLESEVVLFGDVQRVYKGQVGSQSSAYKQNVQAKVRN